MTLSLRQRVAKLEQRPFSPMSINDALGRHEETGQLPKEHRLCEIVEDLVGFQQGVDEIMQPAAQ